MLFRYEITMRLARTALLIAAAICLLASASLLFAAEAPKTRKGLVTVDVKMKAPADAKHVRVWIPYPVSDADQEISDVSVTGNFTKKAVSRDPENGSSILYAEWAGPAAERVLSYTFTAKRQEVLSRDRAAGAAPVPAEALKEYLDLSWLGRTEQRIRDEAGRITAGRTTALDKARAVYLWVVDNMRRDPNAKACGLCDVERLMAEKMGKCADVHTVFVALCRAAGVPARDIWGIRMPRTREGDMTRMQHCWAEFYVPGAGWVPVDAGDVHKIVHDRKLSAEDAKKLPERSYFFGSVDEYRIQLGYAHGTLTPPQAGGPLVYFMYPYAEADNKPLGEDINFNFGYTISFREL